MLQRFSGGSPSVRNKLNAIVDEVNPLTTIRGDEQFIAVKRGPGGSLVSLNIAAVLARVPRVPAASGLFPVTVTKTGGSDGSKTTTANWTYTVKDLAGNTLGTSVGQTRPRPKGKMAFQASDSYGVAFYAADGSLVLWDAGEVPGTGSC